MKKRFLIEIVTLLVLAAVLVGIVVGVYFVTVGVSARPLPGPMERFVARTVRNIAIAWHSREAQNPISRTDEVIAEGREHFADHCASCHGNDGSGDTEMGRGLYPRAPDLRLPPTQNLADHELFYIIENGIRLTGMPAWGTGTPEGEEATWHLVHFIRHLPQVTPEEIEEMETLNPRSPAEIRQELEAERFLRGDDAAPAEPAAPAHVH
jgi:mono/diheme cytochrome c family protein